MCAVYFHIPLPCASQGWKVPLPRPAAVFSVDVPTAATGLARNTSPKPEVQRKNIKVIQKEGFSQAEYTSTVVSLGKQTAGHLINSVGLKLDSFLPPIK